MSPLMTCHYPDLGSASDWLIIALSRLKVVGRHQYRIWDLDAFSSDVISWCHEMSAVFSREDILPSSMQSVALPRLK